MESSGEILNDLVIWVKIYIGRFNASWVQKLFGWHGFPPQKFALQLRLTLLLIPQ